MQNPSSVSALPFTVKDTFPLGSLKSVSFLPQPFGRGEISLPWKDQMQSGLGNFPEWCLLSMLGQGGQVKSELDPFSCLFCAREASGVFRESCCCCEAELGRVHLKDRPIGSAPLLQ